MLVEQRRNLMINKLKTTSFWLGLSGAVVLILDSLSSIFNIKLYSQEVQSIIITICSVLVMLGIVTKKNTDDKNDSSKQELLDDLDDMDI